ncbi:MAG TPA: hypothetical protein VNA04_03985 [Thermoanaerobaculia bacterium]|nr:hypothetical protein [Thermoanaerobaculia bacterium]
MAPSSLFDRRSQRSVPVALLVVAAVLVLARACSSVMPAAETKGLVRWVTPEEINERFIPVRVIDRMQEDGANRPAVAELQRRHSVSGFPTLVIADAGRERARMDGFGGKNAFERMMSGVR